MARSFPMSCYWCLLPAILIGCRASESPDDPQALQSATFSESLQGVVSFIPVGMTGFWLSHPGSGEGGVGGAARVLVCGRGFDSPAGLVGIGAFEGVCIWEFGTNQLRPGAQDVPSPSRVCGGLVDAFTTFPYRAEVDHRFIVGATNEDLLVSALERTGDGGVLNHGVLRALAQGLSDVVISTSDNEVPSKVVARRSEDGALLLWRNGGKAGAMFIGGVSVDGTVMENGYTAFHVPSVGSEELDAHNASMVLATAFGLMVWM